MPLDNKCRNRWPVRLQCAVVIITETESGFITEDDTSPVCHTPSFGKNPVDTAYDVGSVVKRTSAPQANFGQWLMALDVWKEVR
ncbi:hypothetical protein TNCV_3251261 [Trichonephila clavipes]|nr:hypothetical protein TNCV_3251261 [Trichonephila clavipes]